MQRFDSPVQSDFPLVLADCEVNGLSPRQRDNVVLFLGAALTRREGRIVFEMLFERFSRIDLLDERLQFRGASCSEVCQPVAAVRRGLS